MYGIFTYIYHTNQPSVGKYTIHGSYGNWDDPPSGRSFCFHHADRCEGVMESPIMTSGPVLNGDVDHRKKTYPKNPWTLQWKGLNLYSKGVLVLKMAR